MTTQEMLAAALQHHQSGKLAEAQALYQDILTEKPDHSDANHLLGVLAYQAGNFQSAVDLIQRAIKINAVVPEYHRNLGLAFASLGRLDDAAECYRRALNLRPNYGKALHNLAGILREQGKLSQAIDACTRAIGFTPNYAEAHNSLGAMLMEKGTIDPAITAYRKAIAIQPIYPQAYFNLGIALQQKNDFDQAIAAYSAAVEQRPNYTEALTNLGVIYKLTGRLDEAIICYDRAVETQPQNTTAHSNLIYLLEFHPTQTPEAIFRRQQQYERQHAAALLSLIKPFANDRSPDRRLRIGYVSPDLRHHVVGSNLLPLLREHDHQQFEIFCYASVDKPDSMSQRLQSFTDTWRDIHELSDDQAAERIRQDQIDILLDLTLHMADNRLLLFARKPAPIQVSYLGYCGGTGLATIDYRISDPYMDPLDVVDPFRLEKTMRLPHSYWCYQRPDPAPPSMPPPVLRNGYITFGCLNNFAKVSPAAIDVWAQVLAAVPDSRLIIHALPGKYLDAARQRFTAVGVDAGRIEFIGKQAFWQYLQTYHRIDIALDPFPYAGGITTCDGLWMGVPIITLSGQTSVGRGGRSILSNIGLPEWIAYTPRQYVQLAADLAGDINRLKELRDTMRPRMLNSPLMDARQFARDVEAAYRKMWTDWCAS